MSALRLPQLPAGFVVEARGLDDERAVHLDIEGTTFELHPEDARKLGAALVAAAAESDKREEG